MQLLSDIFESVLKLIRPYNAGLWGKVYVPKKIFRMQQYLETICVCQKLWLWPAAAKR